MLHQEMLYNDVVLQNVVLQKHLFKSIVMNKNSDYESMFGSSLNVVSYKNRITGQDLAWPRTDD